MQQLAGLIIENEDSFLAQTRGDAIVPYRFDGKNDIEGDTSGGGMMAKGGGVGVEKKYKIILGKETVEYDSLDELVDDFEDKYSTSEKKQIEIVYGSDLIKPKGEIKVPKSI